MRSSPTLMAKWGNSSEVKLNNINKPSSFFTLSRIGSMETTTTVGSGLEGGVTAVVSGMAGSATTVVRVLINHNQSWGFLPNENSNIEKIDEYFDNPSIIETKIFDLLIEGYSLKQPIDVILKFYPDEVISIIPELEIYGEGDNEVEAINDLKNEIVDLFNDLKEIPERELGKYPKSWKKIINSLIKENGNQGF